MTDPTTDTSIAALSFWELQELIANGLPPSPVEALCGRHGWRRPSMADYAFIDACAERLLTRLALAVSQARRPRP